jgi:hypothetical protein
MRVLLKLSRIIGKHTQFSPSTTVLLGDWDRVKRTHQLHRHHIRPGHENSVGRQQARAHGNDRRQWSGVRRQGDLVAEPGRESTCRVTYPDFHGGGGPVTAKGTYKKS